MSHAELWRHRGTRLYLMGQVVSDAADFVLVLAVSVWTRMLTGSSSQAAMTFFMLALGTLAAPVGGALADRFRRRNLLIAANLGTACMVLLLMFVRTSAELWLIYLVMFAYGVSGAVIGPAQSALLTNVVPNQVLVEANMLLATVGEGMRLVAPLVGTGILVAFGAAPLILADVASFGIAVLTLLSISETEDLPTPSRVRLATEATAGVRHIGGSRALRRLTRAGIVSVIACGLGETGVFVVVLNGLHRPASFVSVYVTVQGIGAVASGLGTARAVGKLGELRTVGLALMLLATSFLMLAVPANLLAVLTGAVLLGASLPLLSVGANTLLQRRTPDPLLGRAFAAYNLLLSIPQTVAIATGAALFTRIEPSALFAVMAVAVMLAACSLMPREEPGQQRVAADAEPAPAPTNGSAALMRP